MSIDQHELEAAMIAAQHEAVGDSLDKVVNHGIYEKIKAQVEFSFAKVITTSILNQHRKEIHEMKQKTIMIN